MDRPVRMHPREVALRKRKSELEFALTFMKGQCLHAKATNDPNFRLYEVATECIEKEYFKAVKELK